MRHYMRSKTQLGVLGGAIVVLGVGGSVGTLGCRGRTAPVGSALADSLPGTPSTSSNLGDNSPGATSRETVTVTPAAETTEAPPAATEHFSQVTLTPPAGWIRTETGGWLQFTPPQVPPGETVAIQVSPGGPSSRDLSEEFRALVRASANGMSTVKSIGPTMGTDRQGLITISQT